MKHNEWENDGFDELLRDALASDAAPPFLVFLYV